MTSDHEERLELLRIGDDKTPIVVSLNKYQGMRFIDIRRFYFDKTTRTPKPSPKGIALKEDEFAQVINFLTEKKAILHKLFTKDLSAVEETHRGSTLEKKAREVAKNRQTTYELKTWPALQFFSIDDSTNPTLVSFNTKIRLIQELSEKYNEFFPYFADLINAYSQAKTSIQFAKAKKTEDIFQHIEIEWSKGLNVKR